MINQYIHQVRPLV